MRILKNIILGLIVITSLFGIIVGISLKSKGYSTGGLFITIYLFGAFYSFKFIKSSSRHPNLDEYYQEKEQKEVKKHEQNNL